MLDRMPFAKYNVDVCGMRNAVNDAGEHDRKNKSKEKKKTGSVRVEEDEIGLGFESEGD